MGAPDEVFELANSSEEEGGSEKDVIEEVVDAMTGGSNAEKELKKSIEKRTLELKEEEEYI